MPDMTNRPFLSLGRPCKGFHLPAPNLVKRRPKGLTTPSHDPAVRIGAQGGGRGGGKGTEEENKERMKSGTPLPSLPKLCIACREDYM